MFIFVQMKNLHKCFCLHCKFATEIIQSAENETFEKYICYSHSMKFFWFSFFLFCSFSILLNIWMNLVKNCRNRYGTSRKKANFCKVSLSACKLLGIQTPKLKHKNTQVCQFPFEIYPSYEFGHFCTFLYLAQINKNMQHPVSRSYVICMYYICSKPDP